MKSQGITLVPIKNNNQRLYCMYMYIHVSPIASAYVDICTHSFRSIPYIDSLNECWVHVHVQCFIYKLCQGGGGAYMLCGRFQSKVINQRSKYIIGS